MTYIPREAVEDAKRTTIVIAWLLALVAFSFVGGLILLVRP